MVGYVAGYSNTAGSGNLMIGTSAGYSNTTGQNNVFVGYGAGFSDTTGQNNVMMGNMAGYGNKGGTGNLIIGASAGSSATGNYNVMMGLGAGANSTGDQNLMIGTMSGYNNSAGVDNVLIGDQVGMTNVSGSSNTLVGAHCDVAVNNLSNATAIGYSATVNASNKVRIGNSSVTIIEGQVNVSVASDRRLKENIEYTDKLGLQFVNDLKTVTFTYKNDPARSHHDGLIAQDVKQVLDDLGLKFSGLIQSENADRTYNLAYAEFVVPLINSVKELSFQNQEQQKQIESQQRELDELKALVSTLVNNQAGQGNK
jgi:hypothetical protein